MLNRILTALVIIAALATGNAAQPRPGAETRVDLAAAITATN